MITLPNRLEDVVKDLEQGNPIDLNRVATLQALDLAISGRRAVEQAIEREQEFDEDFERQIRSGFGTRT